MPFSAIKPSEPKDDVLEIYFWKSATSSPPQTEADTDDSGISFASECISNLLKNCIRLLDRPPVPERFQLRQRRRRRRGSCHFATAALCRTATKPKKKKLGIQADSKQQELKIKYIASLQEFRGFRSPANIWTSRISPEKKKMANEHSHLGQGTYTSLWFEPT